MRKIGVLGSGSWGYALACLLAGKGYEVVLWGRHSSLIKHLSGCREHPRYPGFEVPFTLTFTSSLQEATKNTDFIVESVTAGGLRSVLSSIGDLGGQVPLILTSKGIEQGTGKTLGEVVMEVLGDERRNTIAALSGPSFAMEVMQGFPTSVVAAAYDLDLAKEVADLFATPTFRVYPNDDFRGVSFGGAMKNIIAIACGIADGLNYGHSTMAALMTRGLHEITKIAIAEGCQQQTLMGLSGMGDLFLTCSSSMSRNYRFGQLLASGKSTLEAKKEIDMVVEGSYTCYSAKMLGNKHHIPLPITEMVCRILDGEITVSEAVSHLMGRTVKEERL